MLHHYFVPRLFLTFLCVNENRGGEWKQCKTNKQTNKQKQHVVYLLWRFNPPSSHLPRNLVTLGVMLQSNGEVSPVVELPEGGWLCWTLLESTCLWRTRNLRIKEQGS